MDQSPRTSDLLQNVPATRHARNTYSDLPERRPSPEDTATPSIRSLRSRDGTTAPAASAPEVVSSESCCGPPCSTPLDVTLPQDILTMICDFLSDNDALSLRQLCRGFLGPTERAYARKIDGKPFSITCKQLGDFDSVLQSSGCGRLLGTLRIETSSTCLCQTEAHWTWMVAQCLDPAFSKDRHEACTRKRIDKSKCARLMRSVAKRMSNLQTIELILGPNKSAKHFADIGAYTGQGKRIPPFASVARWATWRALDVILNAFGRAAVKPT